MTEDEDPFFDPDELEEIALAMDAIMEQEAVGYQMVFWISVGAAYELLESYARYKNGSIQDAILCMKEFSKIVEQLKEVVEADEEGY